MRNMDLFEGEQKDGWIRRDVNIEINRLVLTVKLQCARSDDDRTRTTTVAIHQERLPFSAIEQANYKRRISSHAQWATDTPFWSPPHDAPARDRSINLNIPGKAKARTRRRIWWFCWCPIAWLVSAASCCLLFTRFPDAVIISSGAFTLLHWLPGCNVFFHRPCHRMA